MLNAYWVNLPVQPSFKLDPWTYKYLDEEERLVLDRYKVDFKRIEFLAGRILVKKIASEKLGVPIEKIKLRKNEYGKPFMDASCLSVARRSLYFNLTNTSRMVMAAFGQQKKIGVDLEKKVQPSFGIMPAVFTSVEIEAINAQGSLDSKNKAFYMVWTRKEARMKAEGLGFAYHPLSFSVPTSSMVEVGTDYVWYSFEPYPNYFASLVVEQTQACRVEQLEIKEITWGELLHNKVLL